MESLGCILLITLLIQSHGATQVHYLKYGENVTLSCGTCQWEADVDSDLRVDCSFSNSSDYSQKSQCPAGHSDLCKEIKRSTSNICEIRVKRGFFACVTEFHSDTCFMFPFKPSAHYVESFIVAQEEPNANMVSEPIMENSVNVSAGGSINLTCIFKTKGKYSSKPFVVYWIKTDAESSTCVYSYHFTSFDLDEFDEHCAIEDDLLLRRSHTSHPSPTDTNTHNLMISNATHSDSGQYLCVLRVDLGDKQHWTIITNTTVTVGNPDSAKSGGMAPVVIYSRHNDSDEVASGGIHAWSSSVHLDSLQRVCVIGVLLVIGVTVILGFELHRKRTSELKDNTRDVDQGEGDL